MSDQGKYFVQEKLKEISQKEKLTKDETILMLCSLYELDNVEMIINRLSIKYREGLNIEQINKLRVLTSYLKSILDKIQYL